MDVLSWEPATPGNPLLQARNCLVTPHIGWASLAARQRLLEVAVANLRAFLEGKPQHVVKPAQVVNGFLLTYTFQSPLPPRAGNLPNNMQA